MRADSIIDGFIAKIDDRRYGDRRFIILYYFSEIGGYH